MPPNDDALRDRVTELEIDAATRNAHMEALDARVHKTEDVISKVVWAIIGAIILAGMGFVLNGGLQISIPHT
jgi:hypothetical protein